MWHDALPSDEDYIEVAASRGCPHLSFADNEEGVSSGSLSDDVLSSFVVRLEEVKKNTQEKTKEGKCYSSSLWFS